MYIENCDSLKLVDLSCRAKEILVYINSKSLEKIKLPEEVHCLDECFYCPSLKKIYIPKSVNYISETLFSGCISVHIDVDPENKDYSSYSGALFDKDRHTLLAGYSLVHDGRCIIPGCVMKIGYDAFHKCTSLREIIIPDSVTEIGSDSFYGCSSLREISIPESVTKIGEGAFEWCRSLREVRIPDSVTEIGDWAFYGCSSLREVSIPDSVTEIGNWAFDGCDSTWFIVDPNNRFYESINGKLVKRTGTRGRSNPCQ